MVLLCAACGTRIDTGAVSPGEGVPCGGCGGLVVAPGAPSAEPAPPVASQAPAAQTPPPLPRTEPDPAAAPARGEPAPAGGLSSVRTLTKACPSCGRRFPVAALTCPSCGAKYSVATRAAARAADERREPFPIARSVLSTGVVGGVVAIIVAAVWFLLGLQAGYIYFYPLILATVGIGAIVKGVAAPRRRPNRRRPRSRR